FFIHFIGSVFNDGCINKFQAIQKAYDHIQIKLVVEDQIRFQQIKPPLEQIIKKQMGSDCKLEWVFVEKIDAQKSGKYLYTICEIET
ncbi:MAG: phenylacetate--CoA ligase family protein, partial [Deltaproteobacteria bacterium]